ncbi:MAG: hypothetical protein AB1Z18_05900, partial [Desulfobacterales bacterium]
SIEHEVAPLLEVFVDRWRRTVLRLDALVFGGVLTLFLIVSIWAGYWEGLHLRLPFGRLLADYGFLRLGLILLLLLAAGYVHYRIRLQAAARVGRRLLGGINDPHLRRNYARAFRKNSHWWRSIFQRRPVGWGQQNRDILAKVFNNANDAIRNLNDTFANPSGESAAPVHAETTQPQTAGDGKRPADESGADVKRPPLALFSNE